MNRNSFLGKTWVGLLALFGMPLVARAAPLWEPDEEFEAACDSYLDTRFGYPPSDYDNWRANVKRERIAFGQALRRIRQRRGLSVEQLGALVDTPPVTIRWFENNTDGRMGASEQFVGKVQQALSGRTPAVRGYQPRPPRAAPPGPSRWSQKTATSRSTPAR